MSLKLLNCVIRLYLIVTFVISQEYVDIGKEIDYILEGVNLRKCFCKTDEFYYNNACFPTDPTTVPVLLFHDILEPLWVNTSSFRVNEKSGMNCGFGKYVATINPQDLFLLSSGQLLHVPSNIAYGPLDFCVEHVQTEEGITWEVRMCMKSLDVPVCCPFKGKKDIYCTNPIFPIGFGFSLLKDIVVNASFAEPISCSENEIHIKSEMSDPTNPSTSVFVNYNENTTELVVYSDASHDSLPKYLSSDEFCIIPVEKEDVVIYEASFCSKDPVFAHEEFCKDFSCVRKCCPEGNIYSFVDRICIPYNESLLWTPTFHRINDSEEVSEPANLKLSFGFPICKRTFYVLKDEPKDRHILTDTGEMYVFQWGKGVPSPRYCMDNFLSLTNEVSPKTLTCFPDVLPSKSQCSKVKDYLLPILLMISCIFLLITLVVYASIPELHAKLHGKSLLSHVTALFIAYLSLAIVQWSAKTLTMGLCRTFAFIVQISFLGSFFWLNVMCFDIWWTLRSMRPVAETSESFRRRFVYYSVYAWGCPFIIGSVTVVMETLPITSEYAHLILPGFGQKNCWFQDNVSLWVYFYSFVFVLTIVNIVFFICVAVILIEAQRANNGILRTTSKQHQERVWIYLKLFVVMGITWICEVVSWQEGSCEYWIFTDIVNTLQGFFIFLIFICKKNIFAKLRTRGTLSTRKLKRMVQGSSSYGSSSQVTQQSSLDSSRKLSTSLHYHLSKLNRLNAKDDDNEGKK